MSQIRNLVPPIARDDRQKQIIEDAVMLADDAQPDSTLIGYTMLAFYSDGSTRACGYRPSTQDHRIGSTMFEAWVKQTLVDHFAFGSGVRAAHSVLEGEN